PPLAAAGPPTALVEDRRGRALGLADFSPQSQIRLRLLGRDPALEPDRAWLRAALERALAYRRAVVRDSEACRLVASEADHLPGLIVDRYGDALAVQTLTWAMAARQEEVLELLDELLHPATVVERNDVRVRQREGLELRAALLRGAAATVSCRIHGLDFELDLLAGQKTGGFLDQRENWAAAAAYAAAFGSRRVLDVFTYQGGFALHLARTAAYVQAVDSSRPALEAAERNGERNGFTAVDWVEANAFDLLRDYDQRAQAADRFDLIVLDPPAFAKSRKAIETAIAGYKEINLRALKLLSPGGLLVTCSCSHHLSEGQLLELLGAAASDARRELTILERRGQAPDHPVLLGVPETAYLKCIVATAR
ncbi:MAG: class I SAM-dependent rRNA methyltransferase, partial [Terriglobales bacterium]